MSEDALLIVEDLTKHFPLGGGLLSKPLGWVHAVDGVSFTVHKGESFGLVGESGCGKTTLGRLIVLLMEATSGSIQLEGKELTRLSRAEIRPLRQRMQIIFQDPYSSLDPRMKVDSIVTEPLRAIRKVSRARRREVAAELLRTVGLTATDLDKYPHEFSGGQRQRIGIARALCVRPDLIVADEPVSALDVSIRAQVINLMNDLREEFNLSYIFISHDLSVVQHVCDRVAVMYLGTIVELAPAESFRLNPRHPYTRTLLAAIPLPDPRARLTLLSMEGDVPNPIDPPPGCAFHPRCQIAFDQCKAERPQLVEAAHNHLVACWVDDDRSPS
jgi:oligopeptide/dipeptide ABC transporter ATP-binding protein